MMRKVYIRSAALISPQKPLCDEWMTEPLPLVSDAVNGFADPEWKRFVTPLEGRRMNGIMKRALAVSSVCLDEAGISVPDAIIFGTGLGLQENTEAFLEALCRSERTSLRPVHFMQSTHNTIASMIGIRTGSHGYNATYSHGGISFESALSDARTMIGIEKAGNALVGAFDEVTPFSFACRERAGVPASGTVAAFVLSPEREGAVCELAAVRMLYRPSEAKIGKVLDGMLADAGLVPEDMDFVLAVRPGCTDSLPEPFRRLQQGCSCNVFGENFSASAAGMYAAFASIRQGYVPQALAGGASAGNILIYNKCGNDIGFILLKQLQCETEALRPPGR